jgi:large subunit ribosomal protein L8e
MVHLCFPEQRVCCAQVVFRDPVRYKLQKELFVAAEGIYSGQVTIQLWAPAASRDCTGSRASESLTLKTPFLLLQFLYCGKKAVLSIGNTMPLGEMPEGTIICNVEEVSSSSKW